VSKRDVLQGKLRRMDPRNRTGHWTAAHFREGKFVRTQRADKLALDALIKAKELYGGGKKKSPKRKSKRNNSNKNRNNKKK